jgi:hypothetical protein
MSRALNPTTIPLRVIREHFSLPEHVELRAFIEVGRVYEIPEWRVRKTFRKFYVERNELPSYMLLFYKEVLVLQRARSVNGHTL